MTAVKKGGVSHLWTGNVALAGQLRWCKDGRWQPTAASVILAELSKICNQLVKTSLKCHFCTGSWEKLGKTFELFEKPSKKIEKTRFSETRVTSDVCHNATISSLDLFSMTNWTTNKFSSTFLEVFSECLLLFGNLKVHFMTMQIKCSHQILTQLL